MGILINVKFILTFREDSLLFRVFRTSFYHPVRISDAIMLRDTRHENHPGVIFNTRESPGCYLPTQNPCREIRPRTEQLGNRIHGAVQINIRFCMWKFSLTLHFLIKRTYIQIFLFTNKLQFHNQIRCNLHYKETN